MTEKDTYRYEPTSDPCDYCTGWEFARKPCTKVTKITDPKKPGWYLNLCCYHFESNYKNHCDPCQVFAMFIQDAQTDH